MRRRGRESASALDAMIAQATVDCYNEAEQATGLYTAMDENLEVPFMTTVLGIDVTVRKVDMTLDGCIVAICARGRERQAIPVLDLPLPDPPPVGAEWIAAYRRWLGQS